MSAAFQTLSFSYFRDSLAVDIGLEEKVDHLQENIAGVKADVKRLDGKIDAVSASLTEHRIETEKSFGTLRAEMKDSIAGVKDSVAALRTDMTASMAELRAEMKDAVGKLLAWMVSTVIAAIGAAIAGMRFFAAP